MTLAPDALRARILARSGLAPTLLYPHRLALHPAAEALIREGLASAIRIPRGPQ